MPPKNISPFFLFPESVSILHLGTTKMLDQLFMRNWVVVKKARGNLLLSTEISGREARLITFETQSIQKAIPSWTFKIRHFFKTFWSNLIRCRYNSFHVDIDFPIEFYIKFEAKFNPRVYVDMITWLLFCVQSDGLSLSTFLSRI